MVRHLFLLSLILLQAQIFAQGIGDNKYKNDNFDFQVSQNISYGFDEGDISYQLGFWRIFPGNFSIGVRAGFFNNGVEIEKALNNYLESDFSNLPIGSYSLTIFSLPKENGTFLSSINLELSLIKEVSIAAGFGLRYQTYDFYMGEVNFQVPTNNYTPTATSQQASQFTKTNKFKDIIKAYYSLGFNYNIDRYSIGVYGDNLFSSGLSLTFKF